MGTDNTISSIFWHDYETFGVDPAVDRPAQFAGVRTDEELNIIDDPVVLYCRPADDYLPQPEACLVTGITPQLARDKGLCETEFIARINDEFSRPKTCVTGYNSIRFDDEVTRHTLYRNFFDPYAREWQNGNSRWDIIDLARMTRALRPEGINWPNHEDGKPSFRLEQLTVENGIEHQSAHDALSDVYATIEFARLIREKQPRLYHYLYKARNKRVAGSLLNVLEKKPVLHVSGMFPAEKGCLAVVVPIAMHPVNKNGIIAYDLSVDPEPLLSLSIEEIKERLFTPVAELPEGFERIPLKTIHLNKCPAIAPLTTLTQQARDRYQIDLERCLENRQKILAFPGIEEKIQEVMQSPPRFAASDPDRMLYGGGFFGQADKAIMARIHALSPQELANYHPLFEDSRLEEMLFRYRGRNFPESLNQDEKDEWEAFRRARLLEGVDEKILTVNQYQSRLSELLKENKYSTMQQQVIKTLQEYPTQII